MNIFQVNNIHNIPSINLQHSFEKVTFLKPLQNDIFVSTNDIHFAGKKHNQKVNQCSSPLQNRNLNYRQIGKNSRSACPTSLNLANDYNTIFNSMINNGTRVFIDVREEGGNNSEFKKAVDAYNANLKKPILTYINFAVNHDNSTNNIIVGTTEEFIKNLGELITLMNEGGCNVSCGGGQHRTDLFYALSYIFNPKNTEAPLLSKALHINSNLNFRIYQKLFKKFKEKLFYNNAKQTFKYPQITNIRQITGREFDERVKLLEMKQIKNHM